MGFMDRFIDTQHTADKDDDWRRKSGRPPKEEPRSEKISCRLTKKEKAKGLRYCRKHGITEAKLLRASYLAAIEEVPRMRIERILNDFMRPIDSTNLSLEEKQNIREKVGVILRKSAMTLLLVLLCGGAVAATPAIIKLFWFAYQKGKELVYHYDESCIYYNEGPDADKDGCQVVRPANPTPYAPPEKPRQPGHYCDYPPMALCPTFGKHAPEKLPPVILMPGQQQIPATPLQQK